MSIENKISIATVVFLLVVPVVTVLYLLEAYTLLTVYVIASHGVFWWAIGKMDKLR